MTLRTSGSFKDTVTFDVRFAESHRIRAHNPKRIPVVCEKGNRGDPDIELGKRKFLVPVQMLIAQFKYIIQRHIITSEDDKKQPEQTVYLLVGQNTSPPCTAIMCELYQKFKDKDGFLYVTYTTENTFG
eukprot:Platyproteum_vivax@DN8585_c0_g1_i1.p1